MSEKLKCSVCGFESEDDKRITGIADDILFRAIKQSGLNGEVMKCLFEAEKLRVESLAEHAKKQSEYQAKIAEMNVKAAEEERNKICDTCGLNKTCPAYSMPGIEHNPCAVWRPILLPGYKVITSETFTKETFEWKFPGSSANIKKMSVDFVDGARNILSELNLTGDVIDATFSYDEKNNNFIVRGTRIFRSQ